MISHIKGIVVNKDEKKIVIDRSGIGFEVFLNNADLLKIKIGEERQFFTELFLKEKGIELYGFLTKEEIDLFKKLKEISGVGPKSAMELSSAGSLEKLKESIESGEIKGIGQKKLQKILLEITGKVKDIKTKKGDEALTALVSLGFKRANAIDALSSLPKEMTTVEERIKEALKIL